MLHLCNFQDQVPFENAENGGVHHHDESAREENEEEEFDFGEVRKFTFSTIIYPCIYPCNSLIWKD